MGEGRWEVALWIVLTVIVLVLGAITVAPSRIRRALTAGPVVEQEVE